MSDLDLYRTALTQRPDIEAIRSYIPTGCKILELGCGSGSTSALLSDSGYRVTGTDKNASVIGALSKRFRGFDRLEFSVQDPFTLADAYSENTFDLIFHQGILAHFNDEAIVGALRQQAMAANYVIFGVSNDQRTEDQVFGDRHASAIERWEGLTSGAGLDLIDIVERGCEENPVKGYRTLAHDRHGCSGTSRLFICKSQRSTPDKLHYGCGTVYLAGYLNVDIVPDFLSIDRKSDAARHLAVNRTTYDAYYRYDFEATYANRGNRRIVADLGLSMEGLSQAYRRRFSEFVMVHCLEHYPRYELDDFFKYLKRIIRPDCRCIFAVPDGPATAKLYVEAETPETRAKYHNWLFGSQRSRYLHHYCGYDEDSLRALLGKHFQVVEFIENRNVYPALWVRCRHVKD